MYLRSPGHRGTGFILGALLLAVALLSSARPAAAQDSPVQVGRCLAGCAPPPLRPRWTPAKPTQIRLPPNALTGRFVVKFVEGSHIRLRADGFAFDAVLHDRAPRDAARLDRVGLSLGFVLAGEIERLGRIVSRYSAAAQWRSSYAFHPLLARYSVEDRDFAERDELERRSGEELADLDLFYVFRAPPGFRDAAAQERFMNELNRLRIVEQVYPMVATSEPQSPSRDITASQAYLDAAPLGVGARFAWGQPGARGVGVRLADVEYDWVDHHEDFPPVQHLYERSPRVCPYVASRSEHGTAVMGIIAARHNGSGVMGIAPDVDYVLSSTCRPFDYPWATLVGTFSGENLGGRIDNVVVANAVDAAAGLLGPGDVLLIEAQAFGPDTLGCTTNCDTLGDVPMEYYQECYDVIRRATARGIIVVEAAGNGSQSLHRPALGGRFDTSRDGSGAIMVAAATNGSEHEPDAFTNRGARIDLFSWGSGIVTTGYGGGSTPPFSNTDIPRFYTEGFGGTSGASAIVAGVVASLQGVRLSFGQLPLMPSQMRDILFRTGTAQHSSPGSAVPVNQWIGRQPNLAAAIPLAARPAEGFTGPGRYVIRSRSSGRVLDVDISWFHGQDDGQKLIQWDSHGGRNQEFQITELGAGIYEISPRHSLKCLDVDPTHSADGAGLQQVQCPNPRSPRFSIVPDGGGYHIVVAGSGLHLTVSGDSRDNGAPIVQSRIHAGLDQSFEFLRR